LYCRQVNRFGHTDWAHFWAHTARFSIDSSENGTKTRQGNGFFSVAFDERDRRLSDGAAIRSE
jgi:hypothetical protein